MSVYLAKLRSAVRKKDRLDGVRINESFVSKSNWKVSTNYNTKKHVDVYVRMSV